MNFKNVELHNVEALYDVDGISGLGLQRIPEEVRMQLNAGAQNQMRVAAGVEIRLVRLDENVRVVLSCPASKGSVFRFQGSFQMSRTEIGTEPQSIALGSPGRLARLDGKHNLNEAFAPEVCRLLLDGGPFHIHAIEGQVRPPTSQEVPGLKFLSYGTSITQGLRASAPHLSYVAQLARLLNADAINLGSSGSAHCESEMGAYIGGRDDWHFALLELSVNMVGGFTPAEFKTLLRALLEKIVEMGGKKKRPIFCITPLPHFRDWNAEREGGESKAPIAEYRTVVRDTVTEVSDPCFMVVEGEKLLFNKDGLTADLIHPGDFGMAEVAMHLNEILGSRIAKLRGQLEP